MGHGSHYNKCASSQWELSGSYKSGWGRNSSWWEEITKDPIACPEPPLDMWKSSRSA